ncbi:MAG: hypothetical protein KME22_07180 [Hassallia sp. WJT32-NPBG1]|jgi:hypothetical protein|nr:hypothetical protein [Tolypothrix sp. Co-bin9]MBW4607002.1 hypothetical protein [Hassallia sp. WJT32-NPBG1]
MVKRGVMIKEATLQSNKVPTFEDRKFLRGKYISVEKQIIDSACKSQNQIDIDEEHANVPTCICLNLEDLKCFEAVERQYEGCGVIFHNSIAIQPSNPAFPTHSGMTVLMGSPKSGFLEATFLRPVHWVSTFVTSSQRLVLCAYDRHNQLLTQTALPAANLANSDSALPPSTLLSLTANDIHRITFSAFDGQFIIDNFSFCF